MDFESVQTEESLLREENDRLKAVIIKMQAGTKLLRKALDKAADRAIDKYISGIGIN